jgi:hypothetical protein
MVKTNIQTFTGEVEILSNLHVGPSGSSYLTANGAASNVLDITGNVGATFFVGDGGFLSNIATTLSDIVNQGNVSANVLQFNSTSDYAGVGLVTSSNVGIQNTAPSHTLSIGDKIRVNNNTDESLGESVIEVDGRILATRFKGDGGLLSNIATTFESIVNQGNVASNVVKFSSASGYGGAGVITDSNVGIQNTAPTHNLSVGSNLHVNDTGSNVLTVHGNVVASNLNLGVFSITPAYGLNDVCNTSNGTTNVVQFQNGTTSLVASSNITASGNITAQTIISTANVEITDRLKFDGNVFVDTLRVADVAANIVTYDRATGELTDSGGTFLNKFAIVSEQPPSDLFANATTVTDHGSYTLTTSNLATNSNTYNAFDGTANAWTGGTGMYIGGSNVLIETNLTQLSNLHPTQFGDWLAIEFPYKTTLRHMKLTPATVWQSFPYAANLYATNNDLTWTEIKYWDGLNPGSASNVQTITVNATEQFKKYALVTTKLVPNTNIASAVALQDWQLFTESFSIDGGKVAMATSAVMGGETTMDQHGPHGRGVTPLKKYPEIAFDASKLDGNDTANVHTQAGYTVSSSGTSVPGLHDGWKVFDEGDAVTSYWHSVGSTYTSGTDEYSRSPASTLGTFSGEWIKLELPHKIKVSRIALQGRHVDRSFGKWYILGSNDDSTWDIVHHKNTTNDNFDAARLYSYTMTGASKDNYYKYFAILGTHIVGDDTQASLGKWELYGYEEDPPLGDTSVDTTFTSIMNTPQTTGAQVYVDAKLSSDFTNRVVGPTVSNTHTTYVSAEKYWELSGNVESNVTLEANTFLSGDAPHSLSMWFNSSNLEANVSNSCIFSLGTEEKFYYGSLDEYNLLRNTSYRGSLREHFIHVNHGDFGWSVATNSDGSRMIVGCPGEDVGQTNWGAVYIYTYSNGSWDDGVRIGAPTQSGTSDQEFGYSVDMNSNGTKVVVGSRYGDEGANDAGAAYVYSYINGTWTLDTVSGVVTGRIQASDRAANDEFGTSVSMNGDGTRIIVGAVGEDTPVSNAGKAYIYTYSSGSWGSEKIIQASDASSGGDATFGISVGMNSDGTKVVVGAPTHDTGGTNIGAAYVFTYNSGTDAWSQQEKIQASDKSTPDQFGYCVSMSGDGTKIIVTSPYDAFGSLTSAGAAYIYTYNNGSWYDSGNNEQKITASDRAVSTNYGWSAAINYDGTKVIVGAKYEDTGGVNHGAAYIHHYNGSSWSQRKKLSALSSANYDHYGHSVAITSGDVEKFMVGARGNKHVYIYTPDIFGYPASPPKLKLQSNTWHNLTCAYQGEGGSLVTYLDGRKVAEDQVEDTFGAYPPFEIDTYSLGGYTVDASYWNTGGFPARLAYNMFRTTGGGRVTGFHTDNGNYVLNPADANYDAALMTLTDTSGTAHLGHWVSLELPHKLSPSYCEFEHYGNTTSYRLKDFVILGSNYDPKMIKTGFTLLFSGQAHVDNNGTNKTSHVFTGSGKFKYLILLTKTLNSGNSTWIINRLKYYGHRENDLVHLPDPTNVLKYPRRAINTSHSAGDNRYINRFDEVSTTSEYSTNGGTYSLVKAFDNVDDAASTYWSASKRNSISGNLGRYASGAHGAYNGETPTGKSFIPSGATAVQKGEWIKMKSHHKLKLNKIELLALSTTHKLVPSGVLIWGSDDDSNWYLLKTHIPSGTGGAVTYSSRLGVITVNSTVAYKYHAMVMTHMNNSDSNYTLMSISQMKFYGTEEATSVPIQIGGGNIDKVANFRVYDKFVGEDQVNEIWNAQKEEFGRAKSSMTLQKGRLGIGTTEPEGRLAVADEPDPTTYGLQEFPPKPMNANRTHIEGHGIFIASASRITNSMATYPITSTIPLQSQDAYEAFDGKVDVSSGWDSAGGVDQYSESTGAYIGNDVTTTIDGGQISGTFIQLEMPYKVKLHFISLMPQKMSDSDSNFYGGARMPKTGSIVGSNDGVNWYLIASIGQLAYLDGILTPFQTASTTFYSHFRLIGESLTQGANSTWRNRFNLSEFKLFGYREQVTKQSVLHDGQLTLTKNLNVPRIGPALDADDTPRRDRLVVEYNTSTNPVFYNAGVRDTSGRGNHGYLQNDVKYDAIHKGFKDFSGGALQTRKTNDLYKSTGEHSYSGWLWLDSPSTWEVVYGISSLIDWSGNNNLSVFIYSSATGGGGFRVECRGGSATDFAAQFQTSTWFHLGVTYGGSGGTNAVKIYINGERLRNDGTSVAAGTAALTLPIHDQTVRFGGSAENDDTDQTYHMDGTMSNIKFYNTALTAGEIQTLYDMGRCDEGNHVVNFSKTRVGIGLGDGEAPMGTLDVRGEVFVEELTTRSVLKVGSAGRDYGDDEDTSSQRKNLFIFTTFNGAQTEDYGWWIGAQDETPAALDNDLYFTVVRNGTENTAAGIQDNNNNVNMNFTGQHRTFIKDVPFSQVGDLEGLVVSSDQNKYIKMSGGIEAGSNAITTNESLPIVSLSNVATDKKCFGVISASEDPKERIDAYGNFKSFYPKEKGDTRVYINSLGEGAIWVSNIGGNLESGDYITTSNIAGYGQKQESDSLKNYTVAKITMDCDFNPATQPIQQILRSNVIQTYYLGNVHHTKTVPHAFVTTTVGADDTWSNVSVSPSDVTYAEWSNLEANTQNTYTLTYTQTSNVVYDTKYTLTTTANVTESDPWDRVSIDPPSVTYAEYSNLEANTQSSYSLTFTKTTTDEKTPDEWSALESNTQSLYNMVYYQSVEEEVASDYPGAVAHTRVTDVIENELDAHGQIQWEDHATETEKAYKVRYLTASGAQTDSANAVHIAAFVGCTYHCG